MKFLLLISFVALSMSVPLEGPNFLGNDITQVNVVLENDKGIAQKPSQNYGLWPGGRVPYYFNANDYSESDKQKILAGMKMIEDQTRTARGDCIKFTPYKTGDTNYIRIFNGQGGCLSEVGKRGWASGQDISLQVPGCIYKGIAAHELIHALGFFHEQSRPDRDQYIKIHWENIYPQYHYAFDKITNTDTLGFGYDYYSIMQYESTAFTMNGRITMEPINPPGVKLVNAAYKDALTNTDVGEIRKLYGCN